MGYIENNLMPGEEIVYRAKLHWVIFLAPFVLVILGIVMSILGVVKPTDANESLYVGLFIIFAAVLFSVRAFIYWKTSEFGLTNKRVLIKIGWIRRHSLELLLQKIEGIGVDQSFLGRMLNFGTIIITGTGGTKEPFKSIENPLEFRKQVQGRIPK